MPPSEHQSPGASGVPCGLGVHPRLPGEGLGSGQSPPALLALSVSSVSSRSAIVISEPQPPPGMDDMGSLARMRGWRKRGVGRERASGVPSWGRWGREAEASPLSRGEGLSPHSQVPWPRNRVREQGKGSVSPLVRDRGGSRRASFLVSRGSQAVISTPVWVSRALRVVQCTVYAAVHGGPAGTAQCQGPTAFMVECSSSFTSSAWP